MSKHVLDVGQCVPDHGSICRLITEQFDATVVQTDGLEDTLALLRDSSFDLVLVNRKLDADYSDGLSIVERIKGDRQFGGTPVMLVSNFPEAQKQAVAAGAEPGFGKAELSDPATIEKLKVFLD